MQELENYKKEKLTIDLVWANKFLSHLETSS